MRIWDNTDLGPMEKFVALALRDGVKDLEAATGLSPALLKRITAILQEDPEPVRATSVAIVETVTGFEEFWSLYPRQRRAAKSKCQDRYKRIIKSKQATEEEILDGVKRYAASEDVARGYACAPLVWLNQGRWDGIYEPAGQRPEDAGSAGAYQRFLARRGLS